MSREISHQYGPHVHILDDSYLLTLLAQLGQTETQQPLLNTLIGFLYRSLLEVVVNQEFDKEDREVPTRMTQYYPDKKFIGTLVRSNQKVVCVNLARAGTVPSHICYEHLNYFLDPQGVRQDHIFAARVVNQNEQVTGTHLGNTKIGGDIKDAIVLLPDPMGATGNTLASTLEHYKNASIGAAKKFIALHLIITPEYLKYVTARHPEVRVYAIRLDRGLSSARALNAVPGTYWDEEKGLDHKQYIVPGAGGLGEVLNNSFI